MDIPSVGELFFKFFKSPIASRLQLEIVGATFVSKYSPIDSPIVQDILVGVEYLLAREIDLQRHRSAYQVSNQ